VTAYPYQPGAGFNPPAKTINGWAIASLVCGLCGFVVLTIPAAIVLGIIGFVTARPPKGGKVMSIVGILLALLWLAGISIGSFFIYRASTALTSEAKVPIITLLDGIAEADTAKISQVSTFTPVQLPELQKLLPGVGKVTDFTTTGFFSKRGTDGTHLTINGNVDFENGKRKVKVEMERRGGTLIITEIYVR
jgi:hypothetical protein